VNTNFSKNDSTYDDEKKFSDSFKTTKTKIKEEKINHDTNNNVFSADKVSWTRGKVVLIQN